MYIKKIDLANFRSYNNLNILLVPGINVFYGENGSGKTNIIEAVYWTAMTKSFRTTEDAIMIKNERDALKVGLSAEINGMEKNYTLEYDLQNKKKVIRVNDNKLTKLSKIVGELPVVLFSPENIMMIKGEPALRRRFLDDMLSQVSSEYYQTFMKYSKEISHRNFLLKGIRDGNVNVSNLGIWNQQIKEDGTLLLLKRAEALNELNGILQDSFHDEKINVKLKYISKNFRKIERDSIMKDYDQHFKDSLSEEIARAITTIGPHRDDIEVLYNDFQAKSYASEGQQRVSSILIKLAEGIHIKNMKGTYPVILLDDFSSELDNANRGFIGRTFRQFKQIIITTTYKENLKEFKADREFIVSNGKAEII